MTNLNVSDGGLRTYPLAGTGHRVSMGIGLDSRTETQRLEGHIELDLYAERKALHPDNQATASPATLSRNQVSGNPLSVGRISPVAAI